MVSPNDTWPHVEEKVQDWFTAGVREVWLAEPKRRTVSVRRPDETNRIHRDTEELRSDLLPGFAAPVAGLFPPAEPTPER